MEYTVEHYELLG